jgi:hypothetical protein
MTEERESHLHHVVFAVTLDRHQAVAAMFSDLGFTLQPAELTELGLRIALDWDHGIELISPLPGSTASVATSVNAFLDAKGDGIYTVVLQVPGAAAESVTERYGASIRFRQKLEGDGTHLEEIDLTVLGLPLTLLDTNIPSSSAPKTTATASTRVRWGCWRSASWSREPIRRAPSWRRDTPAGSAIFIKIIR